MNSKPTAEAIRQERERARAEYEKRTRGLLFSKDFQTRQDALMHDGLATVGERVMAWILRRSWGEYVLYAMKEDGEPAYQRDCAKQLGIDKKRVSDAVAYYQRRGYLEDRPKLLYPVIAPILGAPPPSDEKSGEYRTFLEQWKVAHSADFQEREVLRSSLKKLNKVILSDYKKWKEQKESAKASLLETEKTISETARSAQSTPFERDQKRVKDKLKQPEKPSLDRGVQSKAQAREYLFAQIAQMQKSFPKTSFASDPIDPANEDHQKLINLILAKLQHWDDSNLVDYCVFCAAKFKGIGFSGARVPARPPGLKNGPEGLGLLVNWAEDHARIELGGDQRRRELVKGAGQ